MKKSALLLCILIMSILVTATANSAFAVGNTTVDLKEGELVNGIRRVVFWSPSEVSLTASLDGNTLEGEMVSGMMLGFSASEIDYTNNGFYYNDKLICSITKGLEAEKTELDITLPNSGNVDITLLPSVGKTVLDVTKKYGAYNIDDLSVADVHILLPNGSKIKPVSIIKALPIEGSAGVMESEADYNGERLRIGDGWNSSTGLGGSTPGVPVYLTFRFDAAELKSASGASAIYEIDTAKISDGSHTLDFFADGEKVKSVRFTVDNTPPTYVSNIKFGQVVSKNFELSVIAVDENAPVNIKIEIDGKDFTGSSLKDLEAGRHTITVVASDQCGNTAAEAYQIIVSDDEQLISKNAVELSMNGLIKLPFTDSKKPEKLEFYTYSQVQKIKSYIYENENQVDYTFGDMTETDANMSPEHFFELSVSEKSGAFKFEYQGIASESVDIAIYVMNPEDQSWQKIGKCPSGAKTTLTIEEPEKYIKSGLIHLKATPDYVISTSDTIFWVTDTQYYSRFDDLNDKYESIMNYAVSLFSQNEIAYVMHTGDVVDDVSETEFAEKQYKAASKYQKIIDDAGIPNGIVSGNHDINMLTADHTLFNKYFGADRYSTGTWYGGNLFDNTCHYDLMTIGGYDFIFLYIGWGVEDFPETVAWANNVLKQYPNRNAILSVHGYLGLDGEWQLDPANSFHYTHTRADELWNKVVVPNNNVVSVFCGHTPGVARNRRQVGDTDRYVWEILADYQYAETGDEPKHKLNGMSCDGEGYIRLVTFDGESMKHVTYSPYHDDYNFFADDEDSFIVSLGLKESKHTLKTVSVSAVSAYDKLDTEIEYNEKDAVFSVVRSKSHGKIIMIAEDAEGNKYDASLKMLDSTSPDMLVILGVIGGIITLTAIILAPVMINRKKRSEKKTDKK